MVGGQQGAEKAGRGPGRGGGEPAAQEEDQDQCEAEVDLRAPVDGGRALAGEAFDEGVGGVDGRRFLVEACRVGGLALEPALGYVGVFALVALQGDGGDGRAQGRAHEEDGGQGGPIRFGKVHAIL